MTAPNRATPAAAPDATRAEAGETAEATDAATDAPSAPSEALAAPAEASGAPAETPAATRAARALAVLRRHWLFSALLAAGLVLRVLVQAGYQPALIYIDTLKYLYGASAGSEPLG